MLARVRKLLGRPVMTEEDWGRGKSRIRDALANGSVEELEARVDAFRKAIQEAGAQWAAQPPRSPDLTDPA